MTAGGLHQGLRSFWTYKMSEISHHPSNLTLNHVQGLDHTPQDIKAPIPTHRKNLAWTSNLNDQILLDQKLKKHQTHPLIWGTSLYSRMKTGMK